MYTNPRGGFIRNHAGDERIQILAVVLEKNKRAGRQRIQILTMIFFKENIMDRILAVVLLCYASWGYILQRFYTEELKSRIPPWVL